MSRNQSFAGALVLALGACSAEPQEVLDAGLDAALVDPGCAGRELPATLGLGRIAPNATDPAIRAGDPDHVQSPPSTPATDTLFVFFPGTGGAPDEYQWIIRYAAARGYHAIGLSYLNDIAVNMVCPGSNDPDCHEKVRQEVLSGTDVSPLVDVDLPNSIDNRLAKVLGHLGWSQYLDGNGRPRWDRVVFAGHSQGGGHAAMMGKLHDVARVVMFSATEPARWTLSPHLTPADRYYAFAHTAEPGATGIKMSWQNLGVPGALTNVESTEPPYGGSHQLETSLAPRPGSPRSNAHNAPVVDAATPLEGELPVLRATWCYLIGP
jgi:hypothetical protein